MRTAFGTLVLIVAAASYGQATFDRAVADITLLQTNEVKRELNITQAQRDRMNVVAKGYNDLAEKLEEKARKGTKPTKSDEDSLQREFTRMRTGVIGVLNATQLRRLREITLQTVGLPALVQKDVAKQVGLSTGQTSQIRNVLEDVLKRVDKIGADIMAKVEREFKDRKPKNDAERTRLRQQIRDRVESERKRVEPQVRRIQDEGRARIMAIMSQGQRTTWNNLLGKPFTP